MTELTMRGADSSVRPEIARLFLEPASIAIVGASADESTAYQAGGRAVLDHLQIYGYQGDIILVHRTADTIAGLPTIRNLRDCATAPDCVVVAVPAKAVVSVLEDCAAVGAKQALILTAGYAELGAEGAAMEQDVLDTATRHGIHLVGPNSTGLVNIRNGLAMSMTSVLTAGAPIAAGPLAMIAQSGAIGSSVVERARLAEVGISHIVSTGNQRDMDIPDFLAFFAQDPNVQAVALYVESIRDGRLFTAGVEELHRAGKHLVAFLGGCSVEGELAAASHTGKIVGRGALELSLMRALGVTVVDDLDDLWLLGSALAAGTGSTDGFGALQNWGIVTFSGGMAVLAAEQMAVAGATLPPLAPATADRVRELLPGHAQPGNPLDLGPGVMPHNFRPFVTALAEDPAMEAVCVPLPMGANGWNPTIVDDILAVAEATKKPFVALWYGGEDAHKHVHLLRKAGVLTVETPTELGRVLKAMVGPSRKADEGHPREAGPDKGAPRQVAASVGGTQALELLASGGIDVAVMRSCPDDADAVVAAAEEIGYPVVLKSGDAGVAHRMELGLVAVGIGSSEELRAALATMRATRPGGTWLVQAMARGGTELVLSVRNAGRLGVFGGVGVGGAAIELLRDIEHVPLPCDQETLDRAIGRLKMRDIVLGFRGRAALDVAWIRDTLEGLARILTEHGLTEIEVNPALVSDSGGVVVDALYQS